MEFRWNEWNTWHIAEHGITPEEAEQVVSGSRPPFPEYRGDGKYAVWGRTEFGRYLQVIYVVNPPPALYVIHARPLTVAEKRSHTRRHR